MKKVYLVLFCLIGMSAALIGVVRGVYKVTDGFFPSNIKSHVGYDEKWRLPLLEGEKLDQITQVLNQKFSYFAKGHQAYVFLSEDGKWVMKFPKFQRYRAWPFLPQNEKKNAHKLKELKWILDSWKTTYEEFPDLASLLYVQINPGSNLKGEVTLIDKLGLQHQVVLADSTFMIQKRAEVFDEFIKARYTDAQMEEAKQGVRDLVGLYRSEYARGIIELDRHITRNMGFSEGKMIHIDPARFVKVSANKGSDFFRSELIHKTSKLHDWLKKYYPELVGTLNEELAK